MFRRRPRRSVRCAFVSTGAENVSASAFPSSGESSPRLFIRSLASKHRDRRGRSHVDLECTLGDDG